eukprot:gi/632969499/ref/XP_007901119.1/ PREDICTED: zinc finger and BTB domain-containing protein 37 [Callorhinchus milii]
MEKGNSIELEVADFGSTVLAQMNELRLQGRLCDIVVNIQDQCFRAHKVVLAASSPYFRDHMALSEMSSVSISIIKNPLVFEQLLCFCYTGRLCLQVADIISYLTAASFLQMQYIIDQCTHILDTIHFNINININMAGLAAQLRHSQRPARDSESPPAALRSLHSRAEGATSPGGGRSQHCPHSSPFGKEQFVRINRVGQWYVETGAAADRDAEDGVRIKTETPDEWLVCGEAGSGAEEGTGHTRPQQHFAITARHRGSRPASSFSETARLSPSGSLCTGSERHRARSESPSKGEEQKQPSVQMDEAVVGGGGYEEYLRDQEVTERWYRYNPRLTCLYCGKSFNQKGSLDRHMRLHMGITPFVCRICGKKYTRKDQLEYHIRKHTGNKPFHCHACGKSFPFQAILNQHLKKNHPSSPDPASRGHNGSRSPAQEGPEVVHNVSTTGPT